MIAVIASSGDSITSRIDPRFGRSFYFAVYNTIDKSLHFHLNPYREVEDWAGKSAVQWVKTQNANMVIASEMGMKIKPMFDKLQIQIIILEKSELMIFEIIEMLEHYNRKV
jgi:predicted Fe-Mo cluster-binding NifX family protein